MDPRFLQARTEARNALALTIAYLFAWLICGKMGSLAPGITGLPQWFEFSCLFVPLLFVFVCGWMIYTTFCELSLDSSPD